MLRSALAPAVRRLSIALAVAAGVAACSSPVAPRENVSPRPANAIGSATQSMAPADSVDAPARTNNGGNQPWW